MHSPTTLPQQQFYIAPDGQDHWSGRLAAPAADGSDGPFASLDGARQALRRLKWRGKLSGPVTVWVRGGRYPLHRPVIFEPEDSWPVTYAAYPGETPVFDGGERITGWRVETVNGQPVWVVDLPEVAAGQWYFRSLFVDGERRPRARLPKVGPEPDRRTFYRMEYVPGLSGSVSTIHNFQNGQDRFVARAGDFRAWHNLTDVEVVALHFWVEERMPVAGYDPAARLVTCAKRSIFRLTEGFGQDFARYYIDNVWEGLSEPGEWYLDRAAGRLIYLPLPGQSPETTSVTAPRTEYWMALQGRPDRGEWVEHLRFVRLTFEHTDWSPTGEFASAPQAATGAPGSLRMEGARFCAFEDGALRHLGGYAIVIGDGCRGIRVVGNEITDLGAGGIHINGADAEGPAARRTGDNRITDNHIAHGGRVFHSGIGVLIRHAFGNDVKHNHIHDFYYSGISCGWVWGYAENVARDNHLEKNHIHDLGHGWLSDMGGIYTLGVQPGTTIVGNWIHDVESAVYGGWAIYPDEGSAHLLIEDNLCYDTSHQAFHEHYGRENIVRNNVFAFGKNAQIALSRAEAHRSFTFSRNIVLTAGQPIYTGGYAADLRKRPFGSDLNLFWSVTGAPLSVTPTGGEAPDAPRLSWEEWQALGYDRHSIVTDPGFADVEKRDFTLRPGSPALSLGFKPISVADTGPRPPERRD